MGLGFVLAVVVWLIMLHLFGKILSASFADDKRLSWMRHTPLASGISYLLMLEMGDKILALVSVGAMGMSMLALLVTAMHVEGKKRRRRGN